MSPTPVPLCPCHTLPPFTCQCSSFLWRRRWRWELCGRPVEAGYPEHPDKATQHSGLVTSISGQTVLEARTNHLASERHVQIKQAPKKSLAPSLFVHCTFWIPISLISDLLKEAVQNPGSSFCQILLRALACLSAFPFRFSSPGALVWRRG